MQTVREANELLDGLDAEFTGRLATPSQPNHAALGIALGGLCGTDVSGLINAAHSGAVEQTSHAIGESDHYVFVMLDGFGMNFVDTLPDSSIMRRNLALEMSSVFPTSTGPNLVAIATGRFPGAHGNMAWNVFIPRLGERITTLFWIRTSDGTSLDQIGFSPSELLLAPIIPFGESRTYTHITHSNLVGTPWSAITQQDHTLGFDDGGHAISEVVSHAKGVISNSDGPTFTYVYWADVDHTAHECGVTHPATRLAVRGAEALVEALSNELRGTATVVATADHGHLDAGAELYDVVVPGDPLRELLVASPAGEQRMLYFHVRAGESERFADEFQSRFGAKFSLMTGAGAIDLGLLGPPSEVSDEARRRAGDFVAVSRGRWALSMPDDPNVPQVMASTHGGITDLETRVPLVVCR